MRELSDTAKTLLANIGMTETGQLWKIASAAGDGATGEQRAAAMLAADALAALHRVDDAERRATASLVALRTRLAEQFDHSAVGYRRNPVWVRQAADDYTRECAAITDGCEQFGAAARPMALLLGMPYGQPTAA